jgi:LPS-assembly lipoprotein
MTNDSSTMVSTPANETGMSQPISRRAVFRCATAFAAAAALSSCGFQLRGSANIPFKTIYIGFSETSPLGNELRRYIRASGDTRIVTDPKEAEAIMEVLSETRDKQIMSLNSQGRVREFALFYRVRFRVLDNAQRELQPPTEIVVKRDITFNESQTLSKEEEEGQLYRNMQSDLVQQILRRLSVIRPQA